MDSGNAIFYYNLGSVYKAQNLYAKAENMFQQANHLDPNDADTHYQLGFFNAYNKNYSEADQYKDMITIELARLCEQNLTNKEAIAKKKHTKTDINCNKKLR